MGLRQVDGRILGGFPQGDDKPAHIVSFSQEVFGFRGELRAVVVGDKVGLDEDKAELGFLHRLQPDEVLAEVFLEEEDEAAVLLEAEDGAGKGDNILLVDFQLSQVRG